MRRCVAVAAFAVAAAVVAPMAVVVVRAEPASAPAVPNLPPTEAESAYMREMYDPQFNTPNGPKIRPVGEVMYHEAEIQEALYTANGSRIITASRDAKLKLWDAATGKPILDDGGKPVIYPYWGEQIILTQDGTRIAMIATKSVTIRDAATLKVLEEIPKSDPGGYSDNFVFSKDGRRFFRYNYRNSKTVQFWDLDTDTKKPVVESPIPSENFDGGRFSPDSKLAHAIFDGNIYTWDAVTGKTVGEPRPLLFEAYGHVFSPDGTRVAVSNSYQVRIYDLATGKEIPPLISSLNGSQSRAFSRDGTHFAVLLRDAGEVRVYNLTTGKPVRSPYPWPILHRMSEGVALGPDGSLVLTCDERVDLRVKANSKAAPYMQPTAVLWNPATGQRTQIPSTAKASFSPDGKRILAVTHDHAQLWEIVPDAGDGAKQEKP